MGRSIQKQMFLTFSVLYAPGANDSVAINTMAKKTEAKQEVILQGVDLLKTYGPTVAVNNLSIDLHRGEVLALVGVNGAGKSTLTKILSGVVPCDQGRIRVGGEAVNPQKYNTAEARRRGIRVVHQELSLCKNLTVYENFYIELYQKFEKKALN